jgi:hypothetical protein
MSHLVILLKKITGISNFIFTLLKHMLFMYNLLKNKEFAPDVGF